MCGTRTEPAHMRVASTNSVRFHRYLLFIQRDYLHICPRQAKSSVCARALYYIWELQLLSERIPLLIIHASSIRKCT